MRVMSQGGPPKRGGPQKEGDPKKGGPRQVSRSPPLKHTTEWDTASWCTTKSCKKRYSLFSLAVCDYKQFHTSFVFRKCDFTSLLKFCRRSVYAFQKKICFVHDYIFCATPAMLAVAIKGIGLYMF